MVEGYLLIRYNRNAKYFCQKYNNSVGYILHKKFNSLLIKITVKILKCINKTELLNSFTPRIYKFYNFIKVVG